VGVDEGLALVGVEFDREPANADRAHAGAWRGFSGSCR
jgi:hypothetical protein